MQTKKNQSIGLVLSGGGARGAYQVGVISAIGQIAKEQNIENPIQIFSGVSAGAINASFMASYCEDFYSASQKLVELWKAIESNQVFYSDAVNIGRIGLKWMSELSMGGLGTGTTPGRALLDTAPLRVLIEQNLPFEKIEQNIQSNHLQALAITAVDYNSSNSITFVQGKENLPTWSKSRRRSEKTEINVDHIMASSAIPMLFPPIQVDERFFGDGCVRNAHPCAPSIYLGASKLIIVGVRRQTMTADEVRALSNDKAPSVARVINLLLNAVLLDGVELDVERMQRMNDFVSKVPEEARKNMTYRPLDYVWISPSADIGEIAASKASRLPRIIRYLIKGLGSLEEASEIVSYLLFDPEFCSLLIEIGYEDGMKQKDEIIQLLKSS